MHYEFDGKAYEKASLHQKEWGELLISALQLKGNESILDLGCGDGVLTARLAELVPDGQVLGIDASVGMLEAAKKHEKENLQFLYMDINLMAFSNAFDVIFSNAALHWVKAHKCLLENSLRALKKGGRILWNFAGEGNCANFFTVIQNRMKENKYAVYFQDFVWPWYMPAQETYQQLISEIGFSQYDVTEKNADRYFSNADEMIKWLDQPSLVPFIKYVPDPLKAEFRNDVIQEMMERTREKDGRCFETFRRLQVVAVK